ncbi:branched-chain amino acid aminotransferase [Neobacillus sp. LXY-4]|uniref:branched-chain amino acid aminotransferase n=1 Tax=Neobacillus sp. LXY-4 TaxID=3379826 RepID=UPI003EDE8E35
MLPDFSEAYIERCDKESEEVLAVENAAFLDQPIDYFNKHKNEFMFLESSLFEGINVDAVSFEVDDVFGTYDVLLGLKLQKKFQSNINEFLQHNLHGEEVKFSLMFNQDDGLWDLNLPFNYVEGFTEQMSIGEAYTVIFNFLKALVESVKEQ